MKGKIIDDDSPRCRYFLQQNGGSSYADETCIGYEWDGELVAAIGYGWYTGKAIHMHIAKIKGSFVSREFLWFAFYYAFIVCAAEFVISIVESGSQSDRIAKHAGFELHNTIQGAGVQGDLNIWIVNKESARLLHYKGFKHGSV